MQCNETINKILSLTQGDILKISKDGFIFITPRKYN